ncbi:MAG: aminotransferase class I/II-fold pyridoxal phosphate-dependent enzyme [Zhengella sp.]|uniref:DegT/DnrJ/EryC1/StrS family aminotransferase n=1 Tax=Zhengella sp. TaxID=2282762 RepID=UPI001D893B5C|nr:aminotransferase class I/II-fold pyridoxal phosphate-dependent enzyme [Notoacmeibacter sp.]MCC0027460.1 aminotransferase class I/II-fold pyridoxal phosphate-dependent enzyme [Brucellaceae bacterium]
MTGNRFEARHVVVTGGAGFIGSHLVDHLLVQFPDANIRVLDALTYAGRMDHLCSAMGSGRVVFTEGDVRDRDTVVHAVRGADAVFHLAAESHVCRSFADPGLFDAVNRLGTRIVLEAAHEAGVARVVHFSTDEVYGPVFAPCEETAALNPSSPYARSKAAAEAEVERMRARGLDVRMLRPSNAVGTRQHFEKLLPRFAGFALAGLALPIEGDGQQERMFLPVGDLARAASLVLSHDRARNGTYNVAARESLNVLEVASRVARAVGVPLRPRHVPDRVVQDRAYRIDGRALAALGFRQESGFDAELARILAGEAERLRAAASGLPERKAIAAPPPLAPAQAGPDTSAARPVAYHVPHHAADVPGRHLRDALLAGRQAGGGAQTAGAEADIRRLTGAQHVWLTHSCTAAMEVAALALDLGPGDEVIVPSFTFAATATAFARTGARIVACDVDPRSLMTDMASLERCITARTRAIVPVHYGAGSVDVAAIAAMTDGRDIAIVEDAAQGAGALRGDKALGTLGLMGCLSFHETKVVHGGQGGALLVNSQEPALLRRIDRIMERGTNFSDCKAGRVSHYEWVSPGSSFRPPEMPAALLRDNLAALPDILARRAALFAIYAEQLGEHAGLPFDLIMPDSETRSNHHIAGLMMRDADAARRLMAFLAARDIQAMSHYKPLHLSGEGRRLGVARHALPQAEAAWRRLVRLPLHTAMNADDAHRVAGAVRAWAGRGTDKPGPRPGKVQAASARSRMEASASSAALPVSSAM